MNWRVRRIIDNLYGPSGSILLHILVLLVLVKFVQVKSRPVQSEFETVIMDVKPSEELEELEQELQELDQLPTVVEAVSVPTVALDSEPPAAEALGQASESVDIGEFDMMETTSPLVFRGLYVGRSAGGRKDALGKYGGGLGEMTERSVLKALYWLKSHQYPDGSWGPHYRVSMTGLALLTFLAHGETTASEEFGDCIRRGLRYMLKTQKEGMFVGGGPAYGGAMDSTQIRSYEHAIGTYAVSEAYGLTSIPFLRLAMEDAVQVVIDGQHEAGSWDYGYRKGPEANIDVSLAGWHLQALEAAMNAGAANRGLRSTIEAGVRGMTIMADSSSGMFRYGTRLKNRGPDQVMTGVAVLCMQLTGHVMDSEARAGMGQLEKMKFTWTLGDTPGQDQRQTATWPLYAWYYITQARFHQGGKAWVTWNRQFAPGLCAMQNPDGSWGPAPSSEEAVFGPVYCTTLATLMLEVYYRFLPSFQPIEVEKPATDTEEGEQDFTIKFG